MKKKFVIIDQGMHGWSPDIETARMFSSRRIALDHII